MAIQKSPFVNKEDLPSALEENAKIYRDIDVWATYTANTPIIYAGDRVLFGSNQYINLTGTYEVATAPDTDVTNWVVITDEGVPVGTEGQVPTYNATDTPVAGTLRYLSDTFAEGDLTSGVLTITHTLGNVVLTEMVVDDTGGSVIPDQTTFTENTITLDVSSQSPITGTWTYVYTAGVADFA